MIKTIDGKPTVICDGCGEEIKFSGVQCCDENETTMLHFCDEHGTPACAEFRICNHCGLPMYDGMTDLCKFYTHVECFEAEMNWLYGDMWFETDEEGEDGGYYAAYDPYLEEYGDTGIHYTTWY